MASSQAGYLNISSGKMGSKIHGVPLEPGDQTWMEKVSAEVHTCCLLTQIPCVPATLG